MPQKSAKKTERATASISPKIKQEIKKIADETDMSESRIVQEALTRFIYDYKAGKVGMFKPKK